MPALSEGHVILDNRSGRARELLVVAVLVACAALFSAIGPLADNGSRCARGMVDKRGIGMGLLLLKVRARFSSEQRLLGDNPCTAELVLAVKVGIPIAPRRHSAVGRAIVLVAMVLGVGGRTTPTAAGGFCF